MPGDAGGVITHGVYQAVRGHAHARGDFNAEHVGGEQIFTGGIHMFTHAERTRKRAAGRMHNRAGMGVVVVKAVCKNAV